MYIVKSKNNKKKLAPVCLVTVYVQYRRDVDEGDS